MSLRTNVVDLRYFKLLVLMDQLILVWNIKGLQHQVPMINEWEILSLLQKLNSFPRSWKDFPNLRKIPICLKDSQTSERFIRSPKDFPGLWNISQISKRSPKSLKYFPDVWEISQISERFLRSLKDFLRSLKDFPELWKISQISERFPRSLKDLLDLETISQISERFPRSENVLKSSIGIQLTRSPYREPSCLWKVPFESLDRSKRGCQEIREVPLDFRELQEVTLTLYKRFLLSSSRGYS